MVLINKTHVRNLIKAIRPEVRVKPEYFYELNMKVEQMVLGSFRKLGSFKTLTASELKNGSDYGIKKRG